MPNTAILEVDGKRYEFPIIEGSENERGIDISNLRKETGLITLDNGYMNTGSCLSAITYLDGEKGILRYRGIPIEELAEHSNFLETSYLLIYGELPTKKQSEDFRTNLTRHTMIHEDMKRFYDGFPRDAHPMAILSSAVNTLSTFYQEEESQPHGRKLTYSILRLLGKLPTIAAFSYKKSIGQPFVYPTNSLTYSANFLKMMFGVPAEEYEVNPAAEHALRLLFMLHADHEQNCSTSTVRLVGSAGTNLYAAISAGIAALWGHLHGGANQRVVEMLKRIQAEGGDGEKFLERVKNREEGVRLMGFGHRVYKNFDPRATIIKKACDNLLSKMGISDPLLDIAMKLEEAALKDDYFVERKLYPNVDFYSGIIYRAIGIPLNMFTVMFAIGRLPGWIAQFKEMVDSPDTKIGRPRQVYTGPVHRHYVPLAERG
ncbi:MAG: citrate synthase [Bdellovibrionales bacterium]|nr:citrate synthase [Bdellovibrionales bacterium]